MSPNFFRTAALSLMMIAQFSGLLAVFWNARQVAAEEGVRHAESAIIADAQLANQIITNQLQSMQAALHTIEQMIYAGTIPLDDSGSLGQLLGHQLIARDEVESIFFGSPDGSFVGIKRDGEQFRLRETSSSAVGRTSLFTFYSPALKYIRSDAKPDEPYDPRTRPWYKQALNSSGQIIWTDVYKGAADLLLGITVARTISKGNDGLAGVLGVDFNVSDLSARILGGRLTESIDAIVIDRTGELIASDDSNPASIKAALAGPWQAMRDAVVRRLNDSAQPVQAPAPNWELLRSESDQKVSLVMPVLIDERDLGWTMVMSQPVSSAMFTTDAQMVNFLSMVTAIVFVPPLIALPVLVWVSKPLNRLVKRATLDPLTGAFSRIEFQRRLNVMLLNRRSSDKDDTIILIAMDLDGFKPINDAFGHQAGDQVLTEFVRRLKEAVRPTDIVGRFGGDEFMVALRSNLDSPSIETAERIRVNCVNHPIVTSAGKVQLGATAGVAELIAGESAVSLISRADRALVQGKSRQKNQSYSASTPMNQAPAPDESAPVTTAAALGHRT